MGGIGSGRRPSFQTTLDDTRQISIDQLAKSGLFRMRVETSTMIYWRRLADDAASSSLRVEANCTNPKAMTMTLRYRVDGRDIAQTFPLEAKPLPYGGYRWYAICQLTRKRASRLYMRGDNFMSRTATGLAYGSQYEAAHYRALRGAEKVREKLGGRVAVMMGFGFPDRPKGMWRKTYDRIRQRGDKYEMQCEDYERRLCGIQ
jgi:hypothetical protein